MKQEAAPGQVETKDRLNRQEEKMEDMSQQLQSIAAAIASFSHGAWWISG